MKILLIIILLIPMVSLGQTKKLKENDSIISNCQLVEKEFIKKNNKGTDYKDLYLRCSIQDYYIKFCEGNVKKEDIEKYINQGVTFKAIIKEGMWDHCSDDPAYAQSRTGKYVVLLENLME